MKKNSKLIRYYRGEIISSLVLLIIGTSCLDSHFPEEKDAFDRDVNFTTTLFEPVMGRTTFYTGIFNTSQATLPLTCEIINMQHHDGTPAPELEEYYPVRVWKTPYLGTEKSIEEVNAKRGIEYRRLFDVRKHSGEVMMWREANSSILRCQPDSGYVFNMMVSNSGGYKVIKQMRLMPIREADFRPSIYDSETGLATSEYVTPTISKMNYEASNGGFSRLIEPGDIHIYFRENKENTNPTTTLTISFFDPAWNVIKPCRFNETNWKDMFQAGFLKKEVGKDDTKVVWDMAYPLPLFEGKSTYTDSSGELASVQFKTSSLSKFGYRRYYSFDFDFAIYKEAHWEIYVHFAKGMPLLAEE